LQLPLTEYGPLGYLSRPLHGSILGTVKKSHDLGFQHGEVPAAAKSRETNSKAIVTHGMPMRGANRISIESMPVVVA